MAMINFKLKHLDDIAPWGEEPTYRSLYDFRVKLQRWRDQITEEQYDDSLDDDHQLAEWFASRSLTSMHLANGPDVGFFRNKDKLSIVWDAGYLTEENIPIWTAKTGEIEILYEDFI